MLLYDIAITFGQEVEVIWARKFSMVSLLWFLVRRFHEDIFPANYDSALILRTGTSPPPVISSF